MPEAILELYIEILFIASLNILKKQKILSLLHHFYS